MGGVWGPLGVALPCIFRFRPGRGSELVLGSLLHLPIACDSFRLRRFRNHLLAAGLSLRPIRSVVLVLLSPVTPTTSCDRHVYRKVVLGRGGWGSVTRRPMMSEDGKEVVGIWRGYD